MNRTIILLAFVFLVLAGIAAYPSAAAFIRTRAAKPDTAPFGLGAYTASTAESVRIAGPSGELVDLSRSGDSWHVASYSASIDAVDRLFTAIAALRAGETVSRNPDNFDSFGVGDRRTTSLTLTGVPGKKTLYIGNEGPGMAGSFYLRLPGTSEVRIAEGGLKDAAASAIDAWRDRTVVAAPKKAWTGITVEGPKRIRMTGRGGVWIMEGDGKSASVSASEMASYTSMLSPLTADSFVDDPAKAAVFDRGTTYTVTLVSEGTTATLSAVPGEPQYLVRRQGNPQVYGVSQYVFDTLFGLVDRMK